MWGKVKLYRGHCGYRSLCVVEAATGLTGSVHRLMCGALTNIFNRVFGVATRPLSRGCLATAPSTLTMQPNCERPFQVIEHPGNIWAVDFASPSGDLVTGCSDAVARTWSHSAERRGPPELAEALAAALAERKAAKEAAAAGGGGGGGVEAGGGGGGLPPGLKVGGRRVRLGTWCSTWHTRTYGDHIRRSTAGG